MASRPQEPEIVRISQKGQATIPKALREKFDIETPGEVFVYEEGGRIIIEPVPSLEDLHGIHADGHEPGEITERMHELTDEEKQREEATLERLRPGEGEYE